MLAPVAVGATLAWSHTGVFAWGWFLLTLLGAAAMHLGANVVNDYFDEASGADEAARQDPAGLATGTGLIASGVMSREATLRLAAGLFAIALACGVVLAAARGWLVMVLGAVGFLLAVFYVAPPVRYGYRGRGLGEVGIFMAFGYLPLVGSYYVQVEGHNTRTRHGRHWYPACYHTGSLPPSFLALAGRRPRREADSGRRARAGQSAQRLLGRDRRLRTGSSIGTVIAGLWPPGAVVAIVGAVPLVAAVRRARRDPILPNYLQLWARPWDLRYSPRSF